MGLTVAIVLSALVVVIAMMTRPLSVAYVYLVILIFFAEYGTDFTSFNASIFFNQAFVKFMNFKLIELMIGSSYLYVLFTTRTVRRGYLRFERILGIMFLGWLFIICLIEILYHSAITVGTWRLLLSGMILFHMLYILLDTPEKVLAFVKAFLVLLTVKALIGLVMYFSGHGVQGLRGAAPFFWDDRLVEAFTLGVILLASLLANYRAIEARGRLLGNVQSLLFLMILLVTIVLCYRRSMWFITAGGLAAVLLGIKTFRVEKYFSLAFVLLVISILVISLPALHNTREKLAFYINSMNVFDEESAESISSNLSHIDNLEQYAKIISSDPRLLLFGFSAREGDDYNRFKAEANSDRILGTAHNGVLNTIRSFGLPAAIIYLLLYGGVLFSLLRVLRLPMSSPFRFIAYGAWAFIVMDLLASLTFIPPFYNSIKGSYFIFMAIFMLRAALYYGEWKQPSRSARPVEDDGDGRIRVLARRRTVQS